MTASASRASEASGGSLRAQGRSKSAGRACCATGPWLPDGRTIEYVIDGLNRRVGTKVNGSLVEGFLYDGQLRPVAWLDRTGAVKATFVYGLHVNVPEYMVSAGHTYRILTDHLGSPRIVVDTSSGAVVQRMDYDAFGNVLGDTAPGFQPFGFAGGANLYAYVGNDPVNFVDPRRLKCRSYWERVWDNLVLTNEEVSGFTIPPLASGALFWAAGLPASAFVEWSISPLAWAAPGFGGATLGAATFTAVETGIIATATAVTNWGLLSLAFEAGVGIGSLIEAAFEDGGNCDEPCGGLLPPLRN